MGGGSGRDEGFAAYEQALREKAALHCAIRNDGCDPIKDKRRECAPCFARRILRESVERPAATALAVPEISDVQAAFPADALDWMPTREQIPAEFWNGHTEWNKIASQWFFSGLPATTEFVPKKGIDPKAALRAIGATLGSYAPQHEHKEAAVAYMLASWFKKVKGWK